MRLVVAISVVVAAACGDNVKGQSDSGVGSDSGQADLCGNLVVDDGEDCDDGNRFADLICDERCRFTCGNGVFDSSVGEICETGIANGQGTCPASCDDGDACTSDVLAGSDCTAACEFSAITAAIDGDGCCPAGANANSDDDCSAMCGNGILETGELCDTDITMGLPGACPTTCNDQQSCTTDALVSANTCQAHCVATPITTDTSGDGCCRPGSVGDSDCAGCGNTIVDPGETCDTAIIVGPGACPVACNDGVACTSDVVINAGTCTAACSYPPVTSPANGDGCCPAPAANANNDNDCQPVCRNNVVEAGEECDDGNAIDTDACRNNCTRPPTAFRFTTLALRDPHAFATVPIFGCRDITDSLLGNAINEQFTANLTTDEDMDGFLDLSPVVVFRPLNQTPAVMPPVELQFANCTPPPATSQCAHDPGSQVVSLTATNQTSGLCLGTLPNTVRPYPTAVTTTSAPSGGACFVTSSSAITFTLAGVEITLTDAQVAAAYQGTPATGATNGLLRGFLSEAAANAIILPMDLAVVGGRSLGELLRGGAGNCMSGSDKDTYNGVVGWWFYLNFTASVRPWTD